MSIRDEYNNNDFYIICTCWMTNKYCRNCECNDVNQYYRCECSNNCHCYSLYDNKIWQLSQLKKIYIVPMMRLDWNVQHFEFNERIQIMQLEKESRENLYFNLLKYLKRIKRKDRANKIKVFNNILKTPLCNDIIKVIKSYVPK